MFKKYLAVLLTGFCFSLNEASAYLVRVTVMEHPGSGHKVAIGHDIHRLFDKEKNLKQMEAVDRKIFAKFEAQQKPLDVLHDYSAGYTLMTNQHPESTSSPDAPLQYQRDSQGKITAEVTYFDRNDKRLTFDCTQQEEQTTWISMDLDLSLSTETDHLIRKRKYEQVELYSINPAHIKGASDSFTIQEALNVDSTARHIHNSDFKELLDSRLGRSGLESEVFRIERSIQQDRSYAYRYLPSRMGGETATLCIKELVDQPGYSYQHLPIMMGGENVTLSIKQPAGYQLDEFRFLLNHGFFSFHSLNKIALLEIMRSEKLAHPVLFLAGLGHSISIEESLKNLGYKKIFDSLELENSGLKAKMDRYSEETKTDYDLRNDVSLLTELSSIKNIDTVALQQVANFLLGKFTRIKEVNLPEAVIQRVQPLSSVAAQHHVNIDTPVSAKTLSFDRERIFTKAPNLLSTAQKIEKTISDRNPLSYTKAKKLLFQRKIFPHNRVKILSYCLLSRDKNVRRQTKKLIRDYSFKDSSVVFRGLLTSLSHKVSITAAKIIQDKNLNDGELKRLAIRIVNVKPH